MKLSLIYKNIYIYRLVMNVLYSNKYRKRFNDIISLIKKEDKNILDLCFGDVYIAKFCSDNGINWIGYDINPNFVKFAQSNGYQAKEVDLIKIEEFPKVEVCILSGSLYHFHPNEENLILKMLNCSNKIIISEPIVNLSSSNSFIGKIARVLSNAGKGSEDFRYNKESIVEMLNQLKFKLNFSFEIISTKRDILIEIKHA